MRMLHLTTALAAAITIGGAAALAAPPPVPLSDSLQALDLVEQTQGIRCYRTVVHERRSRRRSKRVCRAPALPPIDRPPILRPGTVKPR